MSKEIVEQIQAQFDVLPEKIYTYIYENFHPSEKEVLDNVFHPLKNFHCETHKRWQDAEKEHKVTCIYALPDTLFGHIEFLNQLDFIDVWNKTLGYLWKNHNLGSNQSNYLFLMVRTHLITDYGYFDTIDTNKLFRVNDETKSK